MILKCINSKGYALTVDNEYDCIINNEWATLINDNGVTARYSLGLFDNVEEQAAPTPEPVPELVPDTAEQIVTTLSPRPNGHDITVDGEVIGFNGVLDQRGCHISCGVTELTNINTVASQIRTYVPNRGNLQALLLREIITTKIDDGENCRFVLISTNITNNNSSELICEVLDELAVNTQTGENPNSGNDIKIWILETDHEGEDNGEEDDE